MKTFNLLLLLAIQIVFITSSVFAQDARPAAEMKLFSSLVGNWESHVVHRPSTTDEKGYVSKGEATGEWILQMRFLRVTGHSTSDAGRLDYQVLFTYDKRQKIYRRWAFTSNGIALEGTGQWNSETKTMKWTAINVPENVSLTVTSVTKEDGWTDILYGELANGNVLIDQTWTTSKKR